MDQSIFGTTYGHPWQPEAEMDFGRECVEGNKVNPMEAKKHEAMQRRNELFNRWLRLNDELASIEQDVGLRDSNGIAQYQPLFWDVVRERYLAIAPPDKRHAAIKLYRKVHACKIDLYKADLVCASFYLSAAEGTGRYLKEIIPPVTGILLVSLSGMVETPRLQAKQVWRNGRSP